MSHSFVHLNHNEVAFFAVGVTAARRRCATTLDDGNNNHDDVSTRDCQPVDVGTTEVIFYQMDDEGLVTAGVNSTLSGRRP